MKIYRREKYLDYYFMTTRANGLFVASLEIPDMNTLQICPCMIGTEEEDKAWEEAVEVPVYYRNKFNIWHDKKNNYEQISEILREVLGVTQEEIDKVYERDLEMMGFTREIAEDGTRGKYELSNYELKELYRKTKYYMGYWDGDKQRVKNYLIEHGEVGFHWDGALVDVFGEMHPTKRKLYHDFHNNWGDTLDELIDKAVEIFPDEKDFDHAYYYVREGLRDPSIWKKEKTAED